MSSPESPGVNPYVGPRSFDEEDKRYFFGRDEEERQLTSLLIAHRVVLFYAQSGAGKTSLLRASVIPELKRRKKVVVLPLSRVGGDLPPGVDGEQVANIFVFNALVNLAGADAEPGALVGQSLQEGLAPLLVPRADESRVRPTLLILDQFEELFTSHPERYTERAGFFQQLNECLAAFPQLSLLLSMREDHIARLDYYAAQMPNRLRTRFRMERLPVRGALVAVTGPAERSGRPFDPGVAEELVDNLRRIQVGAAREGLDEKTALGDYVEPVHLQIVCRQLWEDLPSDGGTIRAEDVRAFGDVDQALIEFYETTLRKVVDETGIGQSVLRTWFDVDLITPAGTRGLVYRGEAEAGGLANPAVEILNNAYLVRADVRGGDIWYELAHDRLVEPVLRSNRTWRETHLSPLQRQAALWEEQGRPDGLLLRDEALVEAEAWAVANEPELTDVELRFLRACQEARAVAERERQQTRRIRWLAVGATIFGILAFIAAFFAWNQTQRANMEAQRAVAAAAAEAQARKTEAAAKATAEAHAIAEGQARELVEQQARISLSHQLAAQSTNQINGNDFTLALLLAIEAGKRADTAAADAALREALVFPGRIAQFSGHTGKIIQAIWNEDETRILTSSEDGTARIWDAQTGDELNTLAGRKLGRTRATWNADETRILTVHPEGSVRLWDASSGDEVSTLDLDDLSAPSSYWIVDGREIEPAIDDASLEQDLSPLEAELVTFPEIESLVEEKWNRANTRFLQLCSDDDATLCLMNGLDETDLPVLSGHEGAILQLVINDDGSRLLTTGEDGTARIWSTHTGEELAILRGHGMPVHHGAWSPDGIRLFTSGDDGTVRVWDGGTGEQLLVLRGRGAGITGESWNSDGSRILSVSVDKTARVWDAHTGSEIAVLAGHQAAVRQARWNKDETQILTASDDRTARTWDAETGAELHTLMGHTAEVVLAAWNADGTQILTAGADGTARLWDAESGKSLGVLGGHDARLSQAIWSPDETLILTADAIGTARLWDPRTLLVRATLSGHTDTIWQAVWSTDGDQVLTAGQDGTARLWSAPTGAELATLTGHGSGVWRAIWSGDDSLILTAGTDGDVRQYYASVEALAEAACERAVRNLSAGEWQQYLGDDQYDKTCGGLPVHPSMMEVARDLVQVGQIESALAHYERLLELEPDLNIEPKTQVVLDLIAYARQLAGSGDFEGAVLQVRTAIELRDDDPELYHGLCRYGMLAGIASDVLEGCDRAVKLSDGRAEYRDSRGLARAVTGDYEGAIDDFSHFVAHAEAAGLAVESDLRSAWIADLQAGRNPIDPLVLTDLRNALIEGRTATRSVRIGVHARWDVLFEEADYRVIRLGRVETVKMMSFTRPEVFARIKRENPEIELIVRLYDDRINTMGHPTPREFAEKMIPIMRALQPYATKFEIHNEPNHAARIEGWGPTDEDARDFNVWFLRVYDLLKTAHPWAELGFPGLAIPSFLHRDRRWLQICQPAIEQADWLGVHSYWQTPPDRVSVIFHPNFGLTFKYYHEQFPDKPIEITEFGNSNVMSSFPFTELEMAREYVEYYQELFKNRYVRSASAFLMSSSDPTWSSFTWRDEAGRMKTVVNSVAHMERPPRVDTFSR